MNPVLPLPFLIPLLIVVMVGASWLAWKSSQAAPGRLRKILLTLRILTLLALAVFLINPGHWQSVKEEVSRVWAVMIDSSKSMSVKDGETSRIEKAKQLKEQIAQMAKKAEVDVRYYTFDDTIREVKSDASLTPDGEVSDLTSSADQLLSQLSGQGVPLAGVFVLSDGRQTHIPKHSNFELRAQALQIPFYTFPIGGSQKNKDLAIKSPRKTITGFPGQLIQVTAVIHARGFDRFNSQLSLVGEDGKIIDKAKVRIESGKPTVHTFSLKAPKQSTVLKLQIPVQSGELRVSNNSLDIHLRILDDKARVFIAEGAPYWDSKFLAQLLRKQKHMDVVSVHRLSETRWFRIDSGESKPHESNRDVFPDTMKELSAYDLIIFGKNSEHFLNPKRIALLRKFVKDQGGAILFSRSKPYTGNLPELAPLEPVTWKSGITGKFKLQPSPDGEAAGLFGQALPGPDSPVWNNLPELKDAHRIDIVKPFTRVLAYGQLGNSSTQGGFPLLLVRRYGQGVTGLVNADGLWKWDFFPDARELGNMYDEFWLQTIHWMLAYSEFLPGQDYSLNTSMTIVQPHTPIALHMAYRGPSPALTPRVVVTSPSLETPITLVPSEVPSDDGRPRWAASFTPDKPGNYQLKLVLPQEKTPHAQASTPKHASMPETLVTVNPPPNEMDELSSDSDFLQDFASLTGGSVAPDSADDLPKFLSKVLRSESSESLDAGVEWKSSWMHWFAPIAILILLATEWWLRRRNGLV